MNLNRRELVKGAAWSVPVIAAAIATPLTAASQPAETRNRIRFTNVTVTVGKAAGTVYANTKVQVVDGPDPVQGLIVTVTFRQGDIVRTHSFDYPTLPGWGATPIVQVQQDGFIVGEPVEVFFTATANDVDMITGHAVVEAPRWWA